MLLVIPPEYFPAQSTAAAMIAATEVVLLDTIEYSRQSHENRARLRNPDGTQWMTIPLVAGRSSSTILNARIDESDRWRERHKKVLRFNYSTSPFFDHFEARIEHVLRTDSNCLADITCASMRLVASLLNLDIPINRASAHPSFPESVEQVLAAKKEIDHVVPASRAEVDHIKRRTVAEVRWNPGTYRQNFDGFEPKLSSLDLLLNLGPEAASYLRQHSRVYPYPTAPTARDYR